MRNRLIELVNNSFAQSTPEKNHGKTAAEIVVDYLLESGEVIVVPVKIGTKVWCLGRPCGGCPGFNEPVTEDNLHMCDECDKWKVAQCDFDYDLISEWGKYVFATEEEAVKRLAELKKERAS